MLLTDAGNHLPDGMIYQSEDYSMNIHLAKCQRAWYICTAVCQRCAVA